MTVLAQSHRPFSMKITAIFIFLSVLVCGFNTYGQTENLLNRQSVFIEFLGHSATMWSINYERVIKENENSFISVNIGYGPYFIADPGSSGFNIPISVNPIFSKKNHHLEMGIGTGINYFRRVDNYTSDFLRILFTLRIGYRYQEPTGGILFRAGITPIIPAYYFYENRSEFLKDIDLLAHLVGFSAGYTFKKKHKK